MPSQFTMSNVSGEPQKKPLLCAESKQGKIITQTNNLSHPEHEKNDSRAGSKLNISPILKNSQIKILFQLLCFSCSCYIFDMKNV